jgi:hypothetical protein
MIWIWLILLDYVVVEKSGFVTFDNFPAQITEDIIWIISFGVDNLERLAINI